MQVGHLSPVSSHQQAHHWRLETGDWRLFGPFEPHPVIAVALSGGADSMALTLLAQEWVKTHGGRVIALTVDHALRAESRDEARQVALWMAERGIAHHILTPPHAAAGNNLQQAARQWRYDALAKWCREHDVLHCLIAHHADDNSETTLLHQARGVTADGGSGMARIRNYRGVRFLRPLLDSTKNELKEYLRSRAASWIEDPSNTRTKFARVQVRQQLVADEYLRTRTMARSDAERLARQAREQALAAAAIRCATIHPAGFATIHRQAWCALEPRLATMLLANALRCISGAANRARGHEILALADAIRAQPNTKRSLQRCVMTWDEETIHIAREPARVAPPILLKGNGETSWDQRFRVHYTIPENYSVQLGALGITGRKRLKSESIHGSASLPLATPALWQLDELLSVPHIAWQAPHFLSALHLELGFAPAKPLAALPFW